MATASVAAGDDLLAAWLRDSASVVPRLRGRRAVSPADRIRFAFYGRMSTVEYQDEASSRR